MPGVAIKYWAFQQTGWGNVDETQIPPVVIQPSPDTATSSNYPAWEWIGISGQQSKSLELPKKLILHTEPRILTVLRFYTYTTVQYELNFRTQEHLPFISQDDNVVYCEYYSPSFTSRKLRDYLIGTIGYPKEYTNQQIFNYNQTPAIDIGKHNQQENIVLTWQVKQYQERIIKPNFPLAISANFRERHEYQIKSTVSLPWQIRTSIVEYVRWHMPLSISLPDDIDDETLLAALAHIIIDIEENGN